ncbi:ATP-binding protein [Geomonas sp. Red32]|uniref:hybrid sensor histidine kinase/response regulator n=1 Tax=Geomonas sp. Red32 TaxID=2912856 RepID=UPI00202CC24B|nr:ATP-binding protein [Geomonas sp. Red32]MCM0080719.1 ATP-binding protein [Geomonas sp. Red32]
MPDNSGNRTDHVPASDRWQLTDLSPTVSHRRALTLTVIAFLLANLCFDALLFWKVARSRERYERESEIQVTNLSKALEQNVYTLIREVDLTLQTVADAWQKEASSRQAVDGSFQSFMDRQSGRLPTILGLRMANREGRVVFSTGAVAAPNAYIGDRDHFVKVRERENPGLVIGKPVLGRVSHQWVLPISRRLSYPDGSFGGEVHASISLATFSKMFSSLNLGPRGVVSMWNETTTLARHPEKVNGRSAIGTSNPSRQLKVLLGRAANAALYRATAPTDGVRKTYFLNKVGNFPLWVIVGLAEADYLAPWHREIRETELIAALFAAFSLVSAWQLYRYWKFSRRRLSEIVVRETEEQLQSARKLARIGSWIKDLRSGTYIWSDEVYRISGVDPSAASPAENLLMAVAHPDDRQSLATSFELAAQSAFPQALQFRIARQDGTVRWLHLEGKLESSPAGTPERVVGFIHDITENKKGEEERLNLERQVLHSQKLESLGVLAGGIAHDFNNILTAIVGNADLALGRTEEQSPVAENLRRIISAATRAADLAKQMLAYSGKGSFRIEHVRVNAILVEMQHLLEVSISKKARLQLELALDVPAVEADPTQLRQIILNLVINASEAIGDAGGSIRVTTEYRHCGRSFLDGFQNDGELEEGCYVLLEVADDGCGMPREVQARIFDPFFSTKFTGRGLGMAAVLGIIRSHRGAIKVESEQGCGTTFTILLPATGKPVEEESRSTREHRLLQGKVLLVDDEEEVRLTGAELLRELGFTVITGADGVEAVGLVQESPDLLLVLLDLTMPNLDGEQCFNRIREIAPDLPVVICSGYHESEIAGKFKGKGLAAFLQKPYKFSDLKEVLGKVLTQEG